MTVDTAAIPEPKQRPKEAPSKAARFFSKARRVGWTVRA